MSHSRRSFLRNSILVGATGMASPLIGAMNPLTKSGMVQTNKRPRILFFDVNETLLDLTPLKESVTGALNGQSELVPLWFTTMLQYSLVETTGNHFWKNRCGNLNHGCSQ